MHAFSHEVDVLLDLRSPSSPDPILIIFTNLIITINITIHLTIITILYLPTIIVINLLFIFINLLIIFINLLIIVNLKIIIPINLSLIIITCSWLRSRSQARPTCAGQRNTATLCVR